MTEFVYLSEYNNQGYPTLINKDENGENIKKTVSQDILNEVNQNLPEGKTVVDIHPEWIRKSDITTTDNCEIFLSFINEGAGYKNALGYYVYDIDSPPNRFSDVNKIYVIFPNASKLFSGGQMRIGDSMKLIYEDISVNVVGGRKYLSQGNYVFPANKSIGFVCFANQWKRNGRSDAFLNVNHKMYSSDPALNPETTVLLKNHSVNYRSEHEDVIIYGFEDINRNLSYCDHDFNDLVYMVSPSPINAISENSYNTNSEQNYNGYILCEDIISDDGDSDYNDLIVKYNIKENIENGKIRDIIIELQGTHRGASFNHDFGVIIPNIKTHQNCKIFRETYITHTDLTIKKCITNQVVGSGSDKVPLIQNTKQFLPTSYTNTLNNDEIPPSYVKLRITFPQLVEREVLNDLKMPYRFYLDVYRNPDLPQRVSYSIYSDQKYTSSPFFQQIGVFQKHKIIVLEGCNSFRAPKEKVLLRKCYPRLVQHLKNTKFDNNWHSFEKSAPALIKPLITHSDDHKWDNYNSGKISWLKNGKSLILSPTNYYDGEWSFFSNDVGGVLNINSVSSSDILDWNSIVNENLVEELIELVRDKGEVHITRDGDFNFNTNRSFYVSLTSLQTNSGRLVHDTIQGSDTLELLSWTNKKNGIALLI